MPKILLKIEADTVEIDDFCGFNEIKKNIILPISETLKYVENSYNDISCDWKNMPVDIERQKNITMLDVLNYHNFIYFKCKKNENSNKASTVIKLIINVTIY